MWYPQNGFMANGSGRTRATLSRIAAVPSGDAEAPRKPPWSQSKDSKTSGTTPDRRPPKRKMSIGTPSGSSHSETAFGQWLVGAGNRAVGGGAGEGRLARARGVLAAGGGEGAGDVIHPARGS